MDELAVDLNRSRSDIAARLQLMITTKPRDLDALNYWLLAVTYIKLLANGLSGGKVTRSDQTSRSLPKEFIE